MNSPTTRRSSSSTFPVVVSDNTYRSLTVGIFFNDATNNEHYWAEIYITGRPGYGNCRLTGNGTSINDGELRAMDTAQHSYTLTFDMDGGWVYLDQDLSPETGSMGAPLRAASPRRASSTRTAIWTCSGASSTRTRTARRASTP